MATARREVRELEAAVRAAEALLRRSEEIAWSGRAAEAFRQARDDLAQAIHRAALGLERLERAMSHHLHTVEGAGLLASGDPSAALPACSGTRGTG